jgi:hypothetical protein
MNLWAGLIVNRSNLPCVGRPSDAGLPLEEDNDEEEIPHPKRKLQAGDRVGTWLLKKYIKGDHESHARWLCFCTCGCGTTREVRSCNLNSGRSMSCKRGQKRKSV